MTFMWFSEMGPYQVLVGVKFLLPPIYYSEG